MPVRAAALLAQAETGQSASAGRVAVDRDAAVRAQIRFRESTAQHCERAQTQFSGSLRIVRRIPDDDSLVRLQAKSLQGGFKNVRVRF
jgi:hypothetical protein